MSNIVYCIETNTEYFEVEFYGGREIDCQVKIWVYSHVFGGFCKEKSFQAFMITLEGLIKTTDEPVIFNFAE